MTRTVGRAAAGMGAAAAASRVFGGAQVLVVAAVLGTTFLGNTFEAANTFPTVVFELLAARALSAVLVPTFVDLFDREENAEAERQAGGLLGLALVLLGALTVAGIVLAPDRRVPHERSRRPRRRRSPAGPCHGSPALLHASAGALRRWGSWPSPY